MADGEVEALRAFRAGLFVAFGRRRDALLEVLPSLLHGSIHFHPLTQTRANTVDSLLVLAGRLDRETIQAAGRANRPARSRPLATTFGSCLEYLVVLDWRLHRRQFWLAYQSLYLARLELLQLFTASRPRRARPYHVFKADADEGLKRRFGETLPQHDLPSLQRAFLSLLGLIEGDVGSISAGRLAPTDAQRELLRHLRARQRALDLSAVRPGAASPLTVTT
jgi:hypothetical protein